LKKENYIAKLVTTSERISRARELIKKASSMSVPPDPGWQDFSYIAQVKDMMRQARDLLKFIPLTAGIDTKQKKEALDVNNEIDKAEKVMLHRFV
jgi:hypothetical protein